MLNELCESRYNRNIGECSDKELYFALLELVKNMAVDKEIEYSLLYFSRISDW